MKKLLVLGSLMALISGSMMAQVIYPLQQQFNPLGVTDSGIVVGYYGPQEEYVIWNPMTGEQTPIPNSISAGEGVGGTPEFSADGKYVGGTFRTTFEFPKEWSTYELEDIKVVFRSFCRVPQMNNMVYAVGENPDGTEGKDRGVLLQTSTGDSWTATMAAQKLECIAFATDNVGFIGGQKGLFAYTTSRGAMWETADPRPQKFKDTEVEAYLAMDFSEEAPYEGYVVAQTGYNKFAIFHTPDGAETWDTAVTAYQGRWVAPSATAHVGNTFFMVTTGGFLLKSEDKGLNWEVCTIEREENPAKGNAKIGITLPCANSIAFSPNGKTGVIVGENIAARSIDSGKSWKSISIGQGTEILRDVEWIDNQTAIALGDKEAAFRTEDGGQTWTAIEIAKRTDLKAIVCTKDFLAAGGEGKWCRKYLQESQEVSMMGRYNVENGTWDTAGHFGFISDGISMSSGYAISSDGKTVAGLSQYVTPTLVLARAHAHAVAWNEEKGFMDLGSNYSGIGRSARAEAISRDGSVIVGWQDEKGPWNAAVWYRNEDGIYPTENMPILMDPEGEANEYNKARWAKGVSDNGIWVCGQGRSINTGPMAMGAATEEVANQPWIWSKESGYKPLGMVYELEDNITAVGHATNVNDNGTMAVGFITYDGNSMMAFVWTKEHGMLSLDDYLEEVLGEKLGRRTFCSILGMSSNGRYLTAWGFEENEYLAALIDLEGNENVSNETKENPIHVQVYPNPASETLHVFIGNAGETTIRLVDLQGRIVMSEKTRLADNTYTVSGLNEGLYILSVISNNTHKSFKVTIKH